MLVAYIIAVCEQLLSLLPPLGTLQCFRSVPVSSINNLTYVLSSGIQEPGTN